MAKVAPFEHLNTRAQYSPESIIVDAQTNRSCPAPSPSSGWFNNALKVSSIYLAVV